MVSEGEDLTPGPKTVFVDFYLKCSECFWTIISTLKWYPYPVIAFKIAINNLVSVDNQKIDNQPIPKYENNNHDMKVFSSSVSSEKGKKSVDSDSSSESKQEEKHVKKEQLTVPSVSWSFDFPAIWSRVLVWMNKPTAQENLKDQAIIEKKEGSVVEITVITPLAKMLLNNEENKKVVEQLLSKEFWEAVSITTTFVKKEEYFAKKMWL